MSDSESTEATSLVEPKRPLVLVVDDDDAIREALCELLDDAGFATVGARHGLEALGLLTTLPKAPAFILLDSDDAGHGRLGVLPPSMEEPDSP